MIPIAAEPIQNDLRTANPCKDVSRRVHCPIDYHNKPGPDKAATIRPSRPYTASAFARAAPCAPGLTLRLVTPIASLRGQPARQGSATAVRRRLRRCLECDRDYRRRFMFVVSPMRYVTQATYAPCGRLGTAVRDQAVWGAFPGRVTPWPRQPFIKRIEVEWFFGKPNSRLRHQIHQLRCPRDPHV